MNTPLMIKVAYNPLKECKSPCADNECSELPEFTVSVWPDSDHGPADEPIVYHACKPHAERVVLDVVVPGIKYFIQEDGN